MRKLVLSELVTKDSVLEMSGGEPGFQNIGLNSDYIDDQYLAYKLDEIINAGALLLDKPTYQGFAAAWPAIKEQNRFADQMNNLPKHVVSTTLNNLEWNNSTLLKNDVITQVQVLKNQPGKDILVFGSGTLIHLLFENDLFDEYRLMVHPVILGAGKHLYSEMGGKKNLKMTEMKTFASGIVVIVYQRE